MKELELDTTYLHPFISNSDLSSIQKEILSAKKELLDGNGRGNDFLGWLDLPTTTKPEILDSIKADVQHLSHKARIFVVIGIGGSYLGARAVIEALQSEFAAIVQERPNPFIIYAGQTLSEDYYSQLLDALDKQDYAVTVISKSGTTTEPAVAFRIVKSHLENKYGKAEAARRVIAITDAHRGALHNIANLEGYNTPNLL